ncbi:MAG TPA: VWA domain-containing protein [Vicinamibacterales bacterium]
MRFVRYPFLVCLLLVSVLDAQQGQVPGAFRSRITLVPLDVRVVDRDGRPVTDLKQEDFTILEDGLPQQIGHFAFETMQPDPAGVDDGLELRRAPGAGLKAQNRRVFLIVLGRGRLQHPAKGVDGALDFVRTKLLPQDIVAVQAYNRATGFSTDHARAAAVLERFGKAHESIENLLSNRVAPGASARIQADIDRIFDLPGAAARTLTPGTLTNDGRIVDAMRQATEGFVQESIERMNPIDGVVEIRPEEVLRNEQAFSQFMIGAAKSMSDLGTIFMAIEYMRFLEGEKHLVFISENGLLLPSLEDDQSVAALAADARVAIDTIRTGGVQDLPTATVPAVPRRANEAMLRSLYDASVNATRVRGSRAEPVFTAGSMKTFARLTGGQASLYRYASQAFDRIDAATRATYLIGYYPANPDWNGRFRRVQVRVNRPGVTVQHRFGYYGRAQLVPFNKREFMTYARIAAAGAAPQGVHDIEVTMKASLVQSGAGMQVAVEGSIDVSKLTLVSHGGTRKGSLDVAIFCGGRDEELVGERRQKIELTLTEENYRKALETGFVYAARVPVTSMPRHVKIVVYDHAADLVGTASATFARR